MPRVLPSSSHFGSVDKYMKNRGQSNSFDDPNEARRAFQRALFRPVLTAKRIGGVFHIHVHEPLEWALKVYDPFQKEH